MRVVAPIAIVTGTTLVSTNVGTGADPDAYNPATTYAQADRAVLAEVIYESVQDANLGNDPATTTPTWWKVVGPINSMAMFDRRIGTVTVNADVIEVELEPGCVITVLSVRGVVGARVIATQTDPVDGEVYTETQTLIEPSGGGWWNYLFSPIRRATDALFTGFLPYRQAIITVRIENTGGDAECGLLVVGFGVEPGSAEYGATDGIQDYSRFEEDEFGIDDIVERDYADDAELTVEVPKALSPGFRRLLAERRAQATLLVLADSRPDAQYYGLISFRRTFPFANSDVYAITVKGFT